MTVSLLSQDEETGETLLRDLTEQAAEPYLLGEKCGYKKPKCSARLGFHNRMDSKGFMEHAVAAVRAPLYLKPTPIL